MTDFLWGIAYAVVLMALYVGVSYALDEWKYRRREKWLKEVSEVFDQKVKELREDEKYAFLEKLWKERDEPDTEGGER